MDPSRGKNKKHLIAMVSWTIPPVLWKKNTNDNDLTDHSTNLYCGKNTDSNGLTDPSNTAFIFYLLIVKNY